MSSKSNVLLQWYSFKMCAIITLNNKSNMTHIHNIVIKFLTCFTSAVHIVRQITDIISKWFHISYRNMFWIPGFLVLMFLIFFSLCCVFCFVFVLCFVLHVACISGLTFLVVCFIFCKNIIYRARRILSINLTILPIFQKES